MKYFTLVIFCALITSNALAASDSTGRERPTLTLAAMYGSNANYYGQTAADRLPYILSNASATLPGGFYLSGSAYRLLNVVGSGVSAVDASIGFNRNITKKFSAGIGYTRSFYPENSPLLQAANENTAGVTAGYDWSILKTNVSADYSFGSQQDMFFSVSNSRLFDLGSLFSKNDYITIEPAVEIVGGTQHYLEEYTIRKTKRDKLVDKLKDVFTPPGQSGQTETVTTTKTDFDLLSYNLIVPIGYNRSNYLVEASYQVSVLGTKVSDSGKPHSFLNLSFYYQF